MICVLLYSGFLLTGMIASQWARLAACQPLLGIVTQACLSYIMIEVGLEFSADMKHLSAYAVDGLVALIASALPWMFCAFYFVVVFGTPWRNALLVACFAAPTSAGILFTLLAAAGLGSTWLFKKARVLAIVDDLSTILLLGALQILFVGWKPELLMVVFLNIGFLAVGTQWVNRWHGPSEKPWLVLYALLLVGICRGFEALTAVHLGILLPSFVMGCVLRHQTIEAGDDPHSGWDQRIKALFMFLVGCSLPRISLGTLSFGRGLTHVLALTFLCNLGKCFPLLCYQREATRRERLALSIAMFPRGEVGAGVLLIALSYGITGLPLVLGGLSLALNLLLTGLFIFTVKKLLLR